MAKERNFSFTRVTSNVPETVAIGGNWSWSGGGVWGLFSEVQSLQNNNFMHRRNYFFPSVEPRNRENILKETRKKTKRFNRFLLPRQVKVSPFLPRAKGNSSRGKSNVKHISRFQYFIYLIMYTFCAIVCRRNKEKENCSGTFERRPVCLSVRLSSPSTVTSAHFHIRSPGNRLNGKIMLVKIHYVTSSAD